MANSCWPPRAPKTPRQLGTRRRHGRRAKNGVKTAEKPSHRHRHMTTLSHVHADRPQDPSTPSHRNAREILPNSTLDCRMNTRAKVSGQRARRKSVQVSKRDSPKKTITSENGATRPTPRGSAPPSVVEPCPGPLSTRRQPRRRHRLHVSSRPPRGHHRRRDPATTCTTPSRRRP